MEHPDPIRIGTRKSVLAVAQAEMVRHKLMAAAPGLKVELVPMITSGDKNTSQSLADIGGKGLFTKELEEGLLANQIDIAVHSLKDMETRLPPGLMIAAVLEREDPRDCLIAPQAKSFANLPAGACVGTSSMRRAAQLQILRPDLHIIPFRGNVTTRLIKMKKGEADATLLALAGLKRIAMAEEATEILDIERFLPAVGQGIIAIECRENDTKARQLLETLNHAESMSAAVCERSLLFVLDGSCRTPIAGYARLEGGQFRFDAMIAKPDGSMHLRTHRIGDIADAHRMGADAANELLARGGKECIT